MKKLVKETLNEKMGESINESIVGAIITTVALWYLLNFIKELFTSPEQKKEKLEKSCLRDIYWIIKYCLDEPEKAAIYSDEYFYHKISFPPANRYFNKYVIKVNKETKYLNVEIPNINTRAIKLSDNEYDKFIHIIEKIKNNPEDIDESVDEAWVTSHTGAGEYEPRIRYRGDETEEMAPMRPSMKMDTEVDDSILSVVPPPGEKFNDESFSYFVDSLIEALPKNPLLVYKIFRKTLEMHPYLMTKPIGFKSKNAYQSTIKKFEKALDKL